MTKNPDFWLCVIVHILGDNMNRTQISLDGEEYDRAKREAKARGISIAEFVRRAVRDAIPPGARRVRCALVTGEYNTARRRFVTAILLPRGS